MNRLKTYKNLALGYSMLHSISKHTGKYKAEVLVIQQILDDNQGVMTDVSKDIIANDQIFDQMTMTFEQGKSCIAEYLMNAKLDFEEHGRYKSRLTAEKLDKVINRLLNWWKNGINEDSFDFALDRNDIIREAVK